MGHFPFDFTCDGDILTEPAARIDEKLCNELADVRNLSVYRGEPST